MKYSRLMSQVFNTPLLMEPGSLNIFLSALTDRVGIDAITTVDDIALSKEDMRALAGNATARQSRNYQVDGGVAIIPVTGTLTARSSPIMSMSGMASYDSITSDLWQAIDDSGVDSILLDISSPGGQVDELFALSDFIAEIGEIKPIASYTGSMAASAAYAIAAATDTIYASETATVGSVGVIIAHTDASKKLENDGINVTLIYAGDHKVDGNSYEPLSADVKADLQMRVDKTRDLFVDRVARYRGMTSELVSNTEAAVFTGTDAVKVGFADQITTFDGALELMKKKQQDNMGGQLSADSADLPEVAEVADAADVVELADVADTADVAEVAETAEQVSEPLDALAIISACKEAGLDDMATSMIEARTTGEHLSERIATAIELKAVAEAAGLDPAPLLAVIGKPVDLVRCVVEQLQEEAEINSTHVGEAESDAPTQLTTAEIWKLRREQTAGV